MPSSQYAKECNDALKAHEVKNKPTPILQLCDAATKSLRSGQPIWGSGLDAYHARLSPEVVRAVYEALQHVKPTARLYGGTYSTNILDNAIALLDGHNPQ